MLCIGNKVTSLGCCAFQGCVKLENIALPAVLSIDQSTFASDSSLMYVDLSKPTSIKGEFDFLGCTNLTSIDFENITYVTNYTSISCIKLVNVKIPHALTLGEGTFMHCKSLENIKLPLVKNIGASSFAYCINLKSVKVLKSEAFNECRELSEVIISKDTIAIGEDIFTNCPISSITIYYGTDDISIVIIDDWNVFYI